MKASNQTLEVKANVSAKTFTIRTFGDNKLSAKYRTYKMSKQEFESAKNWTNNDWEQFLKTNDYYLIKQWQNQNYQDQHRNLKRYRNTNTD